MSENTNEQPEINGVGKYLGDLQKAVDGKMQNEPLPFEQLVAQTSGSVPTPPASVTPEPIQAALKMAAKLDDKDKKDKPCTRILRIGALWDARTLRGMRMNYTAQARRDELVDFFTLVMRGHKGDDAARDIYEIAVGLNGGHDDALEALETLGDPEDHRRVGEYEECEGASCGAVRDDEIDIAISMLERKFTPHVAVDGVWAVARDGRSAGRALWPYSEKSPIDDKLVRLARDHGFTVTGRGAEISPSVRGHVYQDIRDRAKEAAPRKLTGLGIRSMPWKDGYLIDLGREDGVYVHVTKEGWNEVHYQEGMPVFRDSGGQLPLPVRGATSCEFRKHLGFAEDSLQWQLIRPYMATAFMSDRERPILVLKGPSGSGKTGTMQGVLCVIDPAATDESGKEGEGEPPAEDPKDFAVNAQARYMPMYGNISTINKKQSDMLCRLTTGFEITNRMLYTDGTPYTMVFTRGAVMTAISIPSGLQDDALNRFVVVPVERSDEMKRPENEVRAERHNEEVTGRWLGALLDDMVAVLRGLGKTKLPKYHRFNTIAEAAMILGPEYYAALTGESDAIRAEAALSDDLAIAVAFTATKKAVEGAEDKILVSTEELLAGIATVAKTTAAYLEGGFPKMPAWVPTSSRSLGRLLPRAADNIEAFGFRLVQHRTNSWRGYVVEPLPHKKIVELPKDHSAYAGWLASLPSAQQPQGEQQVLLPHPDGGHDH